MIRSRPGTTPGSKRVESTGSGWDTNRPNGIGRTKRRPPSFSLCMGSWSGTSCWSRHMASWVWAVTRTLVLGLFCAFWGVSWVWACDSQFIQEPTTREPDTIQIDTVAGFLFTTWSFLDGRSLVTVRQIVDVNVDPEVRAMAQPLFYVVTEKNHLSITYIDPEGEGRCVDIRRY